jgi:paraquat-inducible protein A
MPVPAALLRQRRLPTQPAHPMDTIVACETCGLVQRLPELAPGTVAECARCGRRLRKHEVNALGRTAAFTLAALIFYVPANIYPILRMELYGLHSENTVWEGCQSLYEHGERLVALIVFLASMLIPFLKLVGLLYLVATVKLRSRRRQFGRTWVYRTIDVIGPLAILGSLVKLGELATVLPGRGLLAFTAVVVLTILATMSFDPVSIWDPEKRR